MAEIYPKRDNPPAAAFERERATDDRSAEEPSIATLIGGLVADAQDLVRKEVTLAKEEFKGELNKAKESAISLGIGGVVAAIGGLLLILMLVHVLHEVVGLQMWVSYLIVGALFAIVGAVLLMRGRSRMSEVDLVPHETIDSVRKDVEWIKEQTPSDRT